jgi:hypothetical protein
MLISSRWPIPIGLSLGVIAGLLAISVAASLIVPPPASTASDTGPQRDAEGPGREVVGAVPIVGPAPQRSASTGDG